MRIGIGASKRTIIGKKKDADKNGIGIGITGMVRSSSTVGRKTSSYPLSEIVLSAMVMIGTTDLIGAIMMTIGDLIGRLGGERLFTIDWGAGSVCTIGSAIVLDIFPRTGKNLKRWLMLEFLMSSYFAGMPILIGKAAATSSMVSRRVDQDTKEKATVRKTTRVRQGQEL